MDKVDIRNLYTDYKHRLDVRQILEYYGAKNVTETVAADGTIELVHSCLLDHIEPHHANGDANPSATANVEKALYCCYVYWAGDILHLIAKLEGKADLGGIMPVVADFLIGSTRNVTQMRKDLDRLFSIPVYSVDIPSYSERVLDAWTMSHPYMRDVRGISQDTHEMLSIGFDHRENRIVIPHWWQQRLVGWQKRVIPESSYWPGTYPSWPRYKSSPGFPKSETLYNYDTARVQEGTLTAVVVESPMSVAKSYDLGMTHVVATFGAKVSKAQIDLLKEFPRVIVWFDDDKAGEAGAHKLVSRLYRHSEVLVVKPDKDKDLADCTTAEEVAAKLDAAVAAPLWLAEYDAGFLKEIK